MKPRFIVVSGIIGVGKSTFTERLAQLLGYRAIFEPVEDNPYLAKFYEDPKTWAYPMQEHLKHRRFAAYQFAFWGLRCGEFPGVIMDRSIHEDTVFAQINNEEGNIHDLNWDTYLSGFQDFQAFLPEPDLYVFLDAPPEVCKKRIAARDRPEEAGMDGEDGGIPLAYLQRLHKGYQDWLQKIAPRVQVVRLDWSTFKTVEDGWAEARDQWEERGRFTRRLVVPSAKE
jgi:deoxyadenosine/deoxycytidine kinase